MKPVLIALMMLALVSGSALGAVQSRMVAYEHEGEALEGYLAWDDAFPGKRPGVLVVHEWWGLNDYAKRRADQLAAMGYVAFAGDMYGKGKITEHAPQAMEWVGQITANVENWRARAQTALDVLAGQEMVDPSRLAAIGYCFGGATVCQLAYSGAALKGIVSFHGSLPAPEGVEPGTIQASMLLCHGAADAFVPWENIQKFVTGLNELGVDWEMDMYGGAQHSFTAEEADTRGMDGLAYNEPADRRSWARMRAFLEEIFGE